MEMQKTKTRKKKKKQPRKKTPKNSHRLENTPPLEKRREVRYSLGEKTKGCQFVVDIGHQIILGGD